MPSGRLNCRPFRIAPNHFSALPSTMTLPDQPRRSAEEQIRLEDMLREMFEHRICFNEVIGWM